MIERKRFFKRAKINVMLIQAPLNLDASPIPNVGALPPLGLLSIATFIELHLPDVNIVVIDADHLGIDQVKSAIYDIKPDIIGIGVQASESYRSALLLANIAKELGSIVIIGGEHASIRAYQILQNRPFVDYVVIGQGEKAMVSLICGINPRNIPNLVHRLYHSIVVNEKSRMKIKYLPIPNRKFVDLKSYAIQFQQSLESKLTGFKSFTTIKTQDGCMKAIRQGVCSFCKREDLLLLGAQDPHTFWQEIMYLQDLGIDYVWDVSPSFSSIGFTYLKRLAAAKPPDCRVSFRVYARADDLAKYHIVDCLKRIGVENVLVGFDSGNQDCLDSSNKKTILGQHRIAAYNLKRFNIATYSGFVLGHMNETYDSMQDTLNHACELREILGDDLFRTVTCSKLQLYPGTWEYNKFVLSNKDLRDKFENEDDIDIRSLSEKYLSEFLNIDPEVADDISEQIRSLSPIHSGKDMKKKTYIKNRIEYAHLVT